MGKHRYGHSIDFRLCCYIVIDSLTVYSITYHTDWTPRHGTPTSADDMARRIRSVEFNQEGPDRNAKKTRLPTKRTLGIGQNVASNKELTYTSVGIIG